MKAGNKQAGARLRIVLDADVAIGPGKVDILQHIKETGSIAAAGRPQLAGQLTGRMRRPWNTSIGIRCVSNTRPISSFSLGS